MQILSNYIQNKRVNLVKRYLHGEVLDLGCGPAEFLNSSLNIKGYCGIDYEKELINNLKIAFSLIENTIFGRSDIVI